jgi:hypothetical protein
MTLQAVEIPRSDADRRSVFTAAVTEWIQRRREEKISPTEMARLAPELRFATLLSGRALNAIRFVREHPFEACHWAVLEIITVLSVNERGSAQVSVGAIAEMLSRNPRKIFEALAWLKESGFIEDSAIPGKLTIRWPVIPEVAALASDPAAIAAALTRQFRLAAPLKDGFRGTPAGSPQGSEGTPCRFTAGVAADRQNEKLNEINGCNRHPCRFTAGVRGYPCRFATGVRGYPLPVHSRGCRRSSERKTQ